MLVYMTVMIVVWSWWCWWCSLQFPFHLPYTILRVASFQNDGINTAEPLSFHQHLPIWNEGRNERRPPSPLAMADRRSAFAWAQNTKAKKAEKARWGEKHMIWSNVDLLWNWEEKHDLGELFES